MEKHKLFGDEPYYNVPSRYLKVRREMPASFAHVMDYFYDYFSDKQEQHQLFFISKIAEELNYSRKIIRLALNLLIEKEVVLSYDLKEHGKIILINTPENKVTFDKLVSKELEIIFEVDKTKSYQFIKNIV